jgi:ubiquinone/menaquinone biosynthesis C-methylase UbiE
VGKDFPRRGFSPFGKWEYEFREWCCKGQVEAEKAPIGRGWLIAHAERLRIRNGERPLPEQQAQRLAHRVTSMSRIPMFAQPSTDASWTHLSDDLRRFICRRVSDHPDPRDLTPEQFREVRTLIETKVKKLLETRQKGSPRSQIIEQAVKSKYGAVATSGLSSEHDGVRAVAEAFGYTPEQLASIPSEANRGLSCSNPTATANLRPGEVVVDLGCGGGLDVFLAAAKVGPSGRAIGIDMTDEMLELARRNAAGANHGQGYPNVEFHQATIDKLPLPDASADCVRSNCVINLAPDKPAVFREIARVLKPGGRLAVSDIALKKPLTAEIGQDLLAYVGCIAGAIPFEEYRRQLAKAGFAAVEVIDTEADLNAYAKVENQTGCCSAPANS